LAGGLLSMVWIERDLHERAGDALARLEATYAEGGRAALLVAIDALGESVEDDDDDEDLALYAALQTEAGEVLAGELAWSVPAVGWYNLPAPDDPSDDEVFATATRLTDTLWLVVGVDADLYYDRLELTLIGTVWILAAAIPLSTICGWLVSTMVLRRIGLITATAAAVAGDGKLDRRIPLRGTGDEFDSLAAQLNSMLDSIEDLTRNIQHVSAGIAHDLRTPMTRLRNRLAAFETAPDTTTAQRRHLAGMVGQLDNLLAVFDALLRIAQIESGTSRARFAPVDLSALLESLAETYRPVIAQADKHLGTDIARDVQVTGDAQLLTQMIVNLLENAIEHTPAHASLGLGLARSSDGIVLHVTDNGPGIPASERDRVFTHFYRGDQSRGSRGHGLGLALVRAIAKLHAIEIAFRDNAPGLVVDLRFASANA
jgi:signal transduction histidine kinase